ncbi:hypothetical protein G6F68_014980 [Rhizopus microsporus]|nr:hypothetical protein G6F68_014980 [Rhizopus microsporus]
MGAAVMAAIVRAAGAGRHHGALAAWSSAKFRVTTFTRGWPNRPHWRPSVCACTSACTRSTGRPRARATRATCSCAASGDSCGSRPPADWVTRSAGTCAGATPSRAATAAVLAATRSASAGLLRAMLEPAAAIGS